jgi:hypothetical protein
MNVMQNIIKVSKWVRFEINLFYKETASTIPTILGTDPKNT